MLPSNDMSHSFNRGFGGVVSFFRLKWVESISVSVTMGILIKVL